MNTKLAHNKRLDTFVITIMPIYKINYTFLAQTTTDA